MSSYVLGLSCYYHDSAAALLKDGEIISAAQEERFSRKKHDSRFPIDAIRYSLNSQKIRKELKWSAKINLKDGLLKTIEWIEENINILKFKPENYIHKK